MHFAIGPLFSLAQTTKLNDSCDLAMFGAEDTKAFLAFDTQLRAALSKPDPIAVVLLAEYPMRVNEPSGGSYLVASGEALRHHFHDIFTAQVRKAVHTKSIADLFCKYDEGIMYGHGEVWVELTKFGWAIKTVNVDDGTDPGKRNEPPTVKFVCRTDRHRIIVDVDSKNMLRYRAWNAGHSVLEMPDLELLGRKERFDGTGVCAVPVWTFQSGPNKYEVSGAIGCYESTHPPPQGATGDLTVTAEGKGESTSWCY
jgi:hypothetical protein